MFINETEVVTCDFNLSMNPREVQAKLNEDKKARYRLNQDPNGNYYATLDKTKIKKPSKARGTQVLFDSKITIRGTTCVERMCTDPLKWPALSIAATAFMFAKLFDPICWTSSTVDEVLKMGKAFSIAWPQTTDDLLIQNLPTTAEIKGFRIAISIQPNYETGVMVVDLSYVCTQFNHQMSQIFKNNRSKAVIVEFDDVVFSVWFKKDTYYLFDSFNRDEHCNALPMENLAGAAFIMCHNQLSIVCQTIYDNVASLDKKPYKLHTVYIMRIDKIMYDKYTVNEMEAKENVLKVNVKKDTKESSAIKSAGPLGGHEQVSPVPLGDLSELSLQKKRKKKVADAESVKNNEIIAANESGPSKLKETSLNVLDDTLNEILDRIQDRIDAKCRKGSLFFKY